MNGDDISIDSDLQEQQDSSEDEDSFVIEIEEEVREDGKQLNGNNSGMRIASEFESKPRAFGPMECLVLPQDGSRVRFFRLQVCFSL